MSSLEGTRKQTNESFQDEEHPWIIDLDIVVGMMCCNGPMFRPRKTVHTHDLSEANEDRFVRAAEHAVRSAFASARSHGTIDRLLKDAGSPLPHPQDPMGDK
jgi:hypothetical protein